MPAERNKKEWETHAQDVDYQSELLDQSIDSPSGEKGQKTPMIETTYPQFIKNQSIGAQKKQSTDSSNNDSPSNTYLQDNSKDNEP